ncbi:MAG: hypothetical protein ACT4P3_11790 [Betaproteobacteria bacterium]
MRARSALLLVLALAGAAAVPASRAQSPGPVREITRIAGEVYRFRNNNHYSVFAVTPAGVIATDPINADAARWLKGEIAQRFGQPVRYLVYSHDHADHIAGGEVFADTAIVMRFPRERLLFAVDFIPVNAYAFRAFPDAYMPDWIESPRRVELMDFDVLVPGHGPLGTKANVTMFREYLQDLRAEVIRYAREGKSLEDMKQLVTLPRYAAWGPKEWFPLNIEGMHRLVQGNRVGN